MPKSIVKRYTLSYEQSEFNSDYQHAKGFQ